MSDTPATVGLFGGSFSPPHLGHRHALEAFVAAVRPTRMLVMPAAVSPGKAPDARVTAAQRLEMCRLAFGDLPGVEIRDDEIRRGGDSYTVDTLIALGAPGVSVSVLCGADAALALGEWYRPDLLFALARFYCVSRLDDPAFAEKLQEKNRLYLDRFGAAVTLLDTPARPVSSTDLRAALAAGRPTPDLAPSVLDYIQREGLYRHDR
ncbi:MAG: nicotinate (nicotinamide) nucleotide adenylyltransferase [Clostridia bacterium]|nr:nicotinate (nicotinamide) nucleotide adenylyltransferase [Clostridia bacterium]